jgi:hypothetical protein
MIMDNFNKLIFALVLLLIIFASGIGVISYWMLWPYDPITIHSIEILNANKTVEQGGCLSYRIKWTKRIDKQGKVTRYFVNGHKHPIDDSDDVALASAPPGPGEAVIKVNIPELTPTGKGRMQWVITYPVNPLRTETYPKPPAYSDEFTVTEKAQRRGPKGDKGDKGDKGPAGGGFWGR